MSTALSPLLENVGCDRRERMGELVSVLKSTDARIRTHPLGFLQAIVYDDCAEFRLNFWGTQFAKPKIPNWQIHNHRFGFTSRVVFGVLSETRYLVAEDPLGDYEGFRVGYSKEGSKLEGTGQKYVVSPVANIKYVADQSYEIGPCTFHSSKAVSELLVTLMQIGPIATDAPIVLGPASHESSLSVYMPEYIPTEKLIKLLEAI